MTDHTNERIEMIQLLQAAKLEGEKPGMTVLRALRLLKSKPLPYIFRWDRQGRKGQPCEVLVRGKMNSCLVKFADGYTMVTSRNALRRAAPQNQS